jgi:hypothetical protein
VDRDTERAGAPPPDAQDADDQHDAGTPEPGAASPPRRESESGLMNRFLRGVSGLFGQDDEPSDAAAEPPPPEAPPPPEPTAPAEPERLTVTAEEFQRAVQSAKDRELVRERRDWAKARADEGDLAPIRQLAERGDAWAQRALAEGGDTWALGEIKQRELQEQQARENDPIPHVAAAFDASVLHPLLGALPVEDERRIVGQGIVGLEGRQQAVKAAIGALRAAAAEEAVTARLSDERFVAGLLKSEAFRQALIKTPAANKQFRAYFRGEVEEADHVPAVAGARRRENDVMNDWLRGLTPAEPDQGE